MRYLVILNDAPYGSERSYNGFRLAASLAKREGVEVRVSHSSLEELTDRTLWASHVVAF